MIQQIQVVSTIVNPAAETPTDLNLFSALLSGIMYSYVVADDEASISGSSANSLPQQVSVEGVKSGFIIMRHNL